jgi:DNA-binding NarL/FixJ family response regulator
MTRPFEATAMRCLIVDDSPNFLDAARNLLERQGMRVVGTASNSAEALKLVEDLRPDVTLVDVNLGDESGFELTEQLHSNVRPKPSPVILISTYAEQDIADMIAASAAVGFVCKSCLSRDAIRDLLSRRGDNGDSARSGGDANPRRT